MITGHSPVIRMPLLTRLCRGVLVAKRFPATKTYDALNRLTSKTYPDTTSANYYYDLTSDGSLFPHQVIPVALRGRRPLDHLRQLIQRVVRIPFRNRIQRVRLHQPVARVVVRCTSPRPAGATDCHNLHFRLHKFGPVIRGLPPRGTSGAPQSCAGFRKNIDKMLSAGL
jgi:hypothetical protein